MHRNSVVFKKKTQIYDQFVAVSGSFGVQGTSCHKFCVSVCWQDVERKIIYFQCREHEITVATATSATLGFRFTFLTVIDREELLGVTLVHEEYFTDDSNSVNRLDGRK